ncbi:transporter substrate-binding domain-containing protein [Glutamicibacter sp. JL.03c]|uniref:substrate-binding periplasmic protein n=1 Tax=Glutamicibacter sp. JL.03c TaxID=2984842 RepID=UPI0021F6E2FB|nr:transporter substrate-binding domain-containing protein [Glutamicibacter sp. JL.03c]UYQ77304.1 transporter substrate-binding domain-containing protein [Glutamicibacter sp. JL.03c]
MTKTSKVVLSIVLVVVVGLIGGYFGAGLRGGGGSVSGAAATAEGAWLQKIRERGELRVGIASAPPMTAEQPDGTMGGPNVAPLQKLAKEMGVKYVPVAAEWSKMVAGLQADRFDVAAYLDSTSERSLAIQFTVPVYRYEGAWLVREDSGLKTTDDIVKAGKVAMATGTSYERAVTALKVEVVGSESIPQAVTAMKAGRANAVFADLPTLANAAQQDKSLKIVMPKPELFVQDSNYGVNENIDARSLQVLNIAIQSAQNDGTLRTAFDQAGVISPETLGDLEMK